MNLREVVYDEGKKIHAKSIKVQKSSQTWLKKTRLYTEVYLLRPELFCDKIVVDIIASFPLCPKLNCFSMSVHKGTFTEDKFR